MVCWVMLNKKLNMFVSIFLVEFEIKCWSNITTCKKEYCYIFVSIFWGILKLSKKQKPNRHPTSVPNASEAESKVQIQSYLATKVPAVAVVANQALHWMSSRLVGHRTVRAALKYTRERIHFRQHQCVLDLYSSEFSLFCLYKPLPIRDEYLTQNYKKTKLYRNALIFLRFPTCVNAFSNKFRLKDQFCFARNWTQPIWETQIWSQRMFLNRRDDSENNFRKENAGNSKINHY